MGTEGEFSLIEAIGALSALGSFGGGGNIIDPLGIGNNPTQLDIFDQDGLPSGAKYNQPRGSRIGTALKGFDEGVRVVSNPRVQTQTKALGNLLGTNMQGPLPAKGLSGPGIRRLAGQALKSGIGQSALRYAPMVGTALSVGDTIFGDGDAGDKARDVGLMALGGTIGSVVPVVGTGLGIAAGKLVSDGIDMIGGPSEKERKLEEALARLNGGII